MTVTLRPGASPLWRVIWVRPRHADPRCVMGVGGMVRGWWSKGNRGLRVGRTKGN
jgi:hypothetical protein